MKKTLIALILFTFLVIGLSAAGKKDGAGSADSGKGLSGKVIVYCPSPTSLANRIAAGFTAKSGVKVEMFQGTTGKINARLEAEKNNPVADVVILASWSDGLALQDMAMRYDSLYLSKMNEGWVDTDHKLYGTSASAIAVIYNTTQISALNADWEELATDPAYKDKLCMPDPFASGSCKDFVNSFINANGDKGFTIFRELAANGTTIPGSNKPSLNAVITGERAILVAAVDYNGYADSAKGEPLKLYYPKSGTVINPRPAMILKTASHKDAAKAYLDYMLSDEAQRMVCDSYLIPGRKDIQADNRKNVSDIPQNKHDWTWMRQHSSENLAEFGKIFNLQ